ncbi:MMPL family transporter [Thiolapillus brandeum]|uniref:Membrane transport protein MMPL domain-containing protein n=1 Tax=Thiolapillus brandeum TaxID=1076588 RepID=A0A7U6GI29_9GAMM|nr:MMPL family transporter [Thiolapillus brandeum]BAO44043.1 conserved hypothetical protein [Thiolapillus brandeum]
MARRPGIILVLVILLVALAQLVFRTQVQTDMSAFMPHDHDRLQSLLLSQLEQGPAARVWLLALSGASPGMLATASRLFSRKAADSGHFTQVLNGQQQVDEATRKLLFQYRYLLSDRIRPDSYSIDALHRMFLGLLETLRSPLSTFSKALASRDPGGESLYLMQKLMPGNSTLRMEQGVWMDRNAHTALLLLQTRASGTDLDAQLALRHEMLGWLENLSEVSGERGLKLQFAGVPALSLETRQRIREASQRLGILAGGIMLLYMFLVFRSPRRVLMTAFPLLAGVVFGAALVSFCFSGIHGITLAFGTTLLGVAIDYPVHLLTHQQRGETLLQTMGRIRPTLFQGVLSTMLGFSAMLWSDFPGLVQLGLFAISGLFMAVWVTAFVLPLLDGRSNPGSMPLLKRMPGSTWHPDTRIQFALVTVIPGLFLWTLQVHPIWSGDIRALSPVPEVLKEQDRRLRTAMGAADPSAVLLVEGKNVQEVLQREESLLPELQEAVEKGLLKGVESAALLVPAIQRQRQRQSWIPAHHELVSRLNEALADLPFKPGVFAPFIGDLDNSRSLVPLTPDVLQGTLLDLRLQALLLPASGSVIGVMPLVGLQDFAQLRTLLGDIAGKGVWLFDIPKETARMMAGFRDDMVHKASWAFLAIAGLLVVWLRDWRRCLGVLLPVSLAVLVSVMAVLQSGRGMNLFHIVGLLLVAGIGLDYALFFSRKVDSAEEERRTLYALVICCLSTVTVFVLLGLSGIPVLQAIGITVAVGCLAAFLLSWLLAPAVLSHSTCMTHG